MQFINQTQDNDGRAVMATEHAGQSISWDLSIHRQGEKTNLDTASQYINDYFSKLSMADQKEIFECYVDAKEALSNNMDEILLTKELMRIVKRLYRIISFEDVSNWAKKNLSIVVPSKIKSSYDELEISLRSQAGKSYREKTYLYEEYIELAHLAIYLKPMIPIWGEYIKAKNKPTSTKTNLRKDRILNTKNNFREYEAFSLLTGSPAMSVAPMKRLEQYVEMTIDYGKERVSSILGGLGTTELPGWCLAMVVIRRLTVIELSLSNKVGIINLIFHFLNNTINSLDGKFLGQTRKKIFPNNNEEDDNQSVLEAYKIKQEISLGDVMAISIYSEDIAFSIGKIDPTVSSNIIHACVGYMHDLKHFVPQPCQMTLMGWIVSELIPVRSIHSLSRKAILSNLCVATALLWHWGFTDLVGYLTATPDRDEDDMFIGGTSIKVRLNRQEQIELDTYFPFTDDEGQNVCSKSIDLLVKEFSKCDWILNAPDEFKSEMSHAVAPIPINIKSRLAELSILLAVRAEQKHITSSEEVLHV